MLVLQNSLFSYICHFLLPKGRLGICRLLLRLKRLSYFVGHKLDEFE